jgi:hypothetical protein
MVFLFAMAIVGVTSILSSFRFDEDAVLAFWSALAVINNLIFMQWAKKNLRGRLRDMVSERFGAKTSRFGWLKRSEGNRTKDLPPVIG